MKKIIALITLEILGFITLFFLLPSVVIRTRIGELQPEGRHIYPFLPNQPLKFSIKPLPYLNSLTIELKNPMLKNQNNFSIKIQDDNNHTLRTFSFSGQNIGDPGGVLPVKFASITPREGIPSTIVISSSDLVAESLFYYANDSGSPVFKTTHFLPSLRQSFVYNLQNQLSLLSRRSLLYNILYFTSLLILHFLLMIKYVKKS